MANQQSYSKEKLCVLFEKEYSKWLTENDAKDIVKKNK